MPGASRANQFHQRPREESRARTPPEKTDRQSRLRNRIHELEDSQTTSLVFLFSSLSSSSINHLPIPIDHLPFPFLFPSSKARLLYAHACRDLFSGHPERDPSLFTLLRHSSRNQRYKYARTVGCWLRFQGTAKESRGAISFTRELVSAGAKNDPPGPLFNESRNPFRLFSHQNPPCLPTASIPTLFEIFERKKSREEKKKKQLQHEVDDGEEIEKRGMVERNEANEGPSFRGEIESETEGEEEDETRWKWRWDRDEGDKTRRGCVTGRNVPGRSRRFGDRPEALRFARIEGRRRGWWNGTTRASFGTCIFFGHGRKTLRASEGNVCLEDVPRLPERHLHGRGFLLERVNARLE